MKGKVLNITYMAAYVALYIILKYVGAFIPFLAMPNGGSIEIELIVLFIASFHLGYAKGLAVAVISLLVQFLFFPMYIISPLQFLFDYFFPLAVCGMAAFISHEKLWQQELAIVVMMLLKTLCTVISGAYFWMESGVVAGSAPAWIFSITYNYPYNLATMVVCMILVPVVYRRLKKVF